MSKTKGTRATKKVTAPKTEEKVVVREMPLIKRQNEAIAQAMDERAKQAAPKEKGIAPIDLAPGIWLTARRIFRAATLVPYWFPWLFDEHDKGEPAFTFKSVDSSGLPTFDWGWDSAEKAIAAWQDCELQPALSNLDGAARFVKRHPKMVV